MSEPRAYLEIVDGIMSQKSQLLGPLAIRKAQAVPGLVWKSDGRVQEIQGDPKLVIDALLLKFEALAGKLSTTTAKLALEPILKRHPDLELPSKLR